MSGARVPFDLDLPFVVASQELVYGGKRRERSEAFPWRELGVSELDLLQLWRCFKVDCVASIPGFTAGGTVEIDASGPAAIAIPPDMSRGERLHIETPKQRRRRERAAQRSE